MSNPNELEFDPKTGSATNSHTEDNFDELGDEFEAEALENEYMAQEDPAPELEANPEPEPEPEPEEEKPDAAEETPEAEAAEEEAEPEGDSPEPEVAAQPKNELPNMIPRKRLTQEINKRRVEAERARKLEEQMATMKRQLEASTNKDAQKLPVTREELKNAAEKALDGDTDAFAELFESAFTRMQSHVSESVTQTSVETATQKMTQSQLDRERAEAADRWLEKYPELDPNAENYNEDALEEAVDLRDMYEQRGYSPSQAIERAVKVVSVNYGLKDVSINEQPVPERKVPVDPPAQKKAAPAAKKEINQPPATPTSAAKSESPKYDLDNMDQDEWESLPDSVREQLLTS